MGPRELLGRILGRASEIPAPPKLSFSSWDQITESDDSVVQVCHPGWRGVRTVAYAFRAPVVECADLDYWGEELACQITSSGADMVVIQGWPPGSAGFARRLASQGMTVKCVLHSSPAQHGAEEGEARVVGEVLALASEGILDEVGMAKPGVPEALIAAGYPVSYVPNRVPRLPPIKKRDLDRGSLHIGVFAEPFWRKNVVTQLLAVGLMQGAVAHVMKRPDVEYLDGLEIVEHGELPWEEFISLQSSVDLNLYVTLSECHPSTPQESYLAGVPCLISRVSGVFRDDERLWEITTTDLPDDPAAIAYAAQRLLSSRQEAVDLAERWMELHDARAEAVWNSFCRPSYLTESSSDTTRPSP